MNRRSLVLLALASLTAASAAAGDGPALSGASSALTRARTDVTFEIRAARTVPGQSVFVLGDLPELGGGDMTRAVKLEPSEFPVWRLTASLPAERDYRYRYVLRRDAPEQLADPANGTSLSEERTGRTAPCALGRATRRVSVRAPTPFERVRIIGPDGSEVASRPLEQRGPYRVAREMPLRAGDSVELAAADRTVSLRTDAQQLYLTSDATRGSQFPPAEGPASEPRLETIGAFPSKLLENSRPLRICLPRGYDTSPDRRYPVLYLHDGQNVFEPGGPFGCWNADSSLRRLIESGAIPEVIAVGIGNSPARMREYVPPFSAIDSQRGIGHLYARFVTDEVAPCIDARYRTVPDREHRLVGGSSLGGLISSYMAWTAPRFASRYLCMSGSFFLDEILRLFRSRRPDAVTLYLDSGDSGNSNDGLPNTLAARDALLAGGKFSLGGDLLHSIGFGDGHNERSWARRFPEALRAVFNGAELARPDGDIDGDGTVSAKDLDACRSAAEAGVEVRARADLDGSGRLDSADEVLLRALVAGASRR